MAVLVGVGGCVVYVLYTILLDSTRYLELPVLSCTDLITLYNHCISYSVFVAYSYIYNIN